MTVSHSSGVTSSASLFNGTPALLTSTSRWPQAPTTCAIAFSMLSGARTSSATGTARAPAASDLRHDARQLLRARRGHRHVETVAGESERNRGADALRRAGHECRSSCHGSA